MFLTQISARVEGLSSLITQRLETMVEDANRNLIFSKRKAISALFPYAIFLEQGGHQGMADVILRAARASYFGKFMWRHAQPYITALFNKEIPLSLNRIAALASPYVDWNDVSDGKQAVIRWAATISVVPFTTEVGQSVVDALLQIAALNSLRPHIPMESWVFLKKISSLPPVCRGRTGANQARVVYYIRGLGDIEILKSYFLLIWSEWKFLEDSAIRAMTTSIREDFGGIGMQHHREDLIGRLDNIIQELDRGPEYLKQYRPSMDFFGFVAAMGNYTTLKAVLREEDCEAVNAPACTSFCPTTFSRCTDSCKFGQNLTHPRSPVHYLFCVCDLMSLMLLLRVPTPVRTVTFLYGHTFFLAGALWRVLRFSALVSFSSLASPQDLVRYAIGYGLASRSSTVCSLYHDIHRVTYRLPPV